MFAVIVNTITILIGCSIGLLLRKGLPESISDAMMKGLGLCTIIIGIQGMIEEEYILVLIISTIAGIVIGELLDIDGRINRGAERLTSRFAGAGEGAKIAQAFVTSCLIMNVGAMTIVGSLDAGLRGNFGKKSQLIYEAGRSVRHVTGTHRFRAGIHGSSGSGTCAERTRSGACVCGDGERIYQSGNRKRNRFHHHNKNDHVSCRYAQGAQRDEKPAAFKKV